jgi:hypothetical protein
VEFGFDGGSRSSRDNGISFAQHPERSFFSFEIGLTERAHQNVPVLLLHRQISNVAQGQSTRKAVHTLTPNTRNA